MKMKKHTYGNASQISVHMADGGKVSSKGNKNSKKPNPNILGSGAAAKAGKKISGRQRQIDKALKDAGA